MTFYKLIHLEQFLFLSAFAFFFSCTEGNIASPEQQVASMTIDSVFLQEDLGQDKIEYEFLLPYLFKANTSIGDAAPVHKYCNNRFSFCVEYPAHFRKVESDNHDGITLRSSDLSTSIIISAIYNVLGDSIENLIEIRKKVIHFENPNLLTIEKEPNAFTIEGKTKSGFYYVEKVLLYEDKIGSCIIKYDLSKIQEPVFSIDAVLNSFYFYDPEKQLHAVVE